MSAAPLVKPVLPINGHGRSMPTGYKLAVVLRRIFQQQAQELIRQVHALGDLPDRAPSLDHWIPIIAEQVTPFLLPYYEHGAADGLARIERISGRRIKSLGRFVTKAKRKEDRPLPQYDVYRAHVRMAIDQQVFAFADSTVQTSRYELDEAIKKLRSRLAWGLSRKEALDDLAKGINKIFKDPARARAIAATESSRALHSGQILAAKETGLVEGFRWVLQAGACDRCRAIQAAKPIAKLGEPFAVQGNGPYSRIEHPPVHPHCRCSIVEVISRNISNVGEVGSIGSGITPQAIAGPPLIPERLPERITERIHSPQSTAEAGKDAIEQSGLVKHIEEKKPLEKEHLDQVAERMHQAWEARERGRSDGARVEVSHHLLPWNRLGEQDKEYWRKLALAEIAKLRPPDFWGSKDQPYYRPGINPTVDLAVKKRLPDGRMGVLMVRRKVGKTEGNKLAMPGGFHDSESKKGEPWRLGFETSKWAALRELAEETGLLDEHKVTKLKPFLDGKIAGHVNVLDVANQTGLKRQDVVNVIRVLEALKLVGQYDKPGRDPRDNFEARATTTAYTFEIPEDMPELAEQLVSGFDDVEAAGWVPLDELHLHVENLAFDHATILADAGLMPAGAAQPKRRRKPARV